MMEIGDNKHYFTLSLSGFSKKLTPVNKIQELLR